MLAIFQKQLSYKRSINLFHYSSCGSLVGVFRRYLSFAFFVILVGIVYIYYSHFNTSSSSYLVVIFIMHPLLATLCVCYWPPVRVVCLNHEVLLFQPRTVTTPDLGPITGFYVV